MYPALVATIFADPKMTPVTCGCVAGVVAPCPMNTEVGDIVTADGLELDSATVTPPAGAATESVTGKVTD